MKEYVFDKQRFLIEVTITGIFCFAIMILAIILALTGYLAPLMIGIACIAAYTCWNSFVSKSNSEKVIVDDTSIRFYAYHREDVYTLSEIRQLRIREFPSSGKMYIRIDHYNAFKGRYWLQTNLFSDGKELFHKLLDIEYAMHPDTLKARARRVNSEYLDAEKKGLFEKGKQKRRRKCIVIKRK